MNKTINQIWLGGQMPAREKAWCDGVREKAQAAGWQYKLWRDKDVDEAFGAEPVAALFRAARKVLLGAVTATLMSDYYRLRILADAGGLYLDTDFECTAWPELPDDGDMWTAAERFNSDKPCNCLLWCLNPDAVRMALDDAETKLMAAMQPDSPEFELQYIEFVRRDQGGLVAGIGPRWIRSHVLPQAKELGFRWGIVPTSVAGHAQWPEHGPLCHHGVAWWHEGRKAEQAELWTSRAKAAKLRLNTPNQPQMKIDLSTNSVCFSVNPWRQSFMRRLFAERGITPPPIVPGRKVAKQTRAGEPASYSGHALDFIEQLFKADSEGLPYVIFYEDDAFPCGNPQAELDALMRKHPLPSDCGILCMGDINGVSSFRGRQTLLLPDCAEVYTRLEPWRAENKGSHAMVVFRAAFIPYAQAIIENGVTDCATSRICNYGNLAAYGMFRHPLFTQHKYPAGGHRLPELYAANRAGLDARFPEPMQQTHILLPAPRRIWLLSNAPGKDLGNLPICEDDLVVMLNRARDASQAFTLKCARLLLCRKDNRSKDVWFLPPGGVSGYDDVLLLSDSALRAERPWMKDYVAETKKLPTTGWIAYRLLRDHFPSAHITLVDFNPGGDIGTYKWPRHAWDWEEAYYRRENVERVSAIG